MHSIGINDNHIESIEAAARSRVISNNNDCGGGAESSRMHKLQQQNNSSASVRQFTGCGMNDIDIDERDSDTEHENDKENVNNLLVLVVAPSIGKLALSTAAAAEVILVDTLLSCVLTLALQEVQDSDQL
jgi:hypothetical protein